MDGFDDLLSSSSSPFDHNPFAGPFDKPQSSSLDPWSSFDQQQDSHEPFSAGFDEALRPTEEHAEETSTHGERPNEVSPEERSPLNVVDIQDMKPPLSVDETDESTPTETSPGFRESVEAEAATEKRSLLKDDSPFSSKDVSVVGGSQPLPHAPPSNETTKASSPTLAVTDQLQTSHSLSSPSASSSRQFVSPLESPNPVLSSFASLALGGESTGGWQDTEYSPPPVKVTDNTVESENGPQSAATDTIEERECQPSSKKDSEKRPLFQISVEDPQKVGDPIRPYILYTVHTKTTSPLFSKPSFSVLRRYSDFLWLYDTLCLNNPGVIVPPVPEKNPFGRFDNLFVQQRRLALEICIRKIANHPVLAKDPDLKLFLESDNFALDIKHRKTENALSGGGILSSIGQTLTGSRFSEVDDWFDRKKAYLDGLESQFKSLVKAIDLVSRQRAELATATGEFSQSVAELSESDLNKDLCYSLARLSGVEKKAQDLQHTQAQEDTITLMATVEEYSRVINSVRVAFATRVRCHSQWQNAENELRRVKQSYERARNQGRIPPERTGPSLAHIAELERRALDAKHDFERCSKLVKSELARFEEERIGDLKTTLEVFLEGMIRRQKELINTWEEYQELLLKRVKVQPVSTNGQGAASTT